MSVQAQVTALKQQLEHLFPGKWISGREKPKFLLTGLAGLDGKLGRGIVRQHITEWSGPPSSGKTTLLRSAIAGWCASGLHVAYIDTESRLRAADWAFTNEGEQAPASPYPVPGNADPANANPARALARQPASPGIPASPGRFWVIRPGARRASVAGGINPAPTPENEIGNSHENPGRGGIHAALCWHAPAAGGINPTPTPENAIGNSHENPGRGGIHAALCWHAPAAGGINPTPTSGDGMEQTNAGNGTQKAHPPSREKLYTYACDQLIRSNAFDVVVLDLGEERFKLSSRMYARLQNSLSHSKAALIVIRSSSSASSGWGCHTSLNFRWGDSPGYEPALRGIATIFPSVQCAVCRDGFSQNMEVALVCHAPNRLFTHPRIPDRRAPEA